LDVSDAKKGAMRWRKSFIWLGFALGRENREEFGIDCLRGVRLGDGARKEMEEDADLRAPCVRDQREKRARYLGAYWAARWAKRKGRGRTRPGLLLACELGQGGLGWTRPRVQVSSLSLFISILFSKCFSKEILNPFKF